MKYISSFEDVKFITATDAARIYQPPHSLSLNRAQLLDVAKHFQKSSNFMTLNGTAISPAQAFYAVSKALIDPPSSNLELVEPLGPVASFRSNGKRRLDTKELLVAAKKALDYIDHQNCLPTSLSVGESAQLSPQDFLATACRLLHTLLSCKPLPKRVNVSTTGPPNQKYITAANFKKACKWGILPRNFKGPEILEQIRLQAWTLKPAIAVESTPA